MLREELLKYSQEVQSYLLASSSLGIVLLDRYRNILDCNLGFMRLFSPSRKPVGAPLGDYFELDGTFFYPGEDLRLLCSRKSGLEGIVCCRLLQVENGQILFCERLMLLESRALEQIGSINDDLINLQRELVKKNHLLEKLRQDLDLRIKELESAHVRVKRLEGIVPVCMYCKKIRDDKDVWNQMEKYISEHSDAQFSHSICPSCFDKHHPEPK